MQMRTALQEGSESEEDKEGAAEAVEEKVALYNDCIAAMAFLLDKERGFHRVRHAVARCVCLWDDHSRLVHTHGVLSQHSCRLDDASLFYTFVRQSQDG